LPSQRRLLERGSEGGSSERIEEEGERHHSPQRDLKGLAQQLAQKEREVAERDRQIEELKADVKKHQNTLEARDEYLGQILSYLSQHTTLITSLELQVKKNTADIHTLFSLQNGTLKQLVSREEKEERTRESPWRDLGGFQEKTYLSKDVAGRSFSVEELVKATDQFHSKNKIGESSIGETYVGRLGSKSVLITRLFSTFVDSNQDLIQKALHFSLQ